MDHVSSHTCQFGSCEEQINDGSKAALVLLKFDTLKVCITKHLFKYYSAHRDPLKSGKKAVPLSLSNRKIYESQCFRQH